MRSAGPLWSLCAFVALAGSACTCGGKVKSVEELPSDPRSASADVAGAVQARSPNFQLPTTTSPGGGKPASPSFTLRSGIVAATQSTTEGQP